jgi:hypothetical protein
MRDARAESFTYEQQERTLTVPRGVEAQDAQARHRQVEGARQYLQLDQHPDSAHRRQHLRIGKESTTSINCVTHEESLNNEKEARIH